MSNLSTMPRRFVAPLGALCLLISAVVLVPRTGATVVDPSEAARPVCDPIDPAACLLPFPNDLFTVADPTTDSGRRVDLDLAAMPRNVAGKPVDPTEWNRNDGFSPGSPVLAVVPGLDLHQTWGTTALPARERDHLADPARYAAPDAPILLINASTGERHPFWSELDTHPETSDLRRAVIVRPAVNFDEATRYLVVLRSMRDTSGAVIEANPVFAAMRDGALASPTPELRTRADDIDRILDEAAAAEAGRGLAFDRSQVHLAWEFTVASEGNLAGRVLHMRDHAFGLLGDATLDDRVVDGNAPGFEVVSAGPNGDKWTVKGTIRVPNYLAQPQYEVEDMATPEVEQFALPGSRILYGLDGNPMQNPVQPFVHVPFDCHLPPSATAATPAHPIIYGHGLLGSRREAGGGSTGDLRARNFAVCATDWWGMSEADLVNAVTILADVSNFPSLADRSQQGFVIKLYLARLMAHPAGLAAHPAFRDAGGSRIQTGFVDYDGNSQGAIMGGSLVALSPDFRRGVLGVPGMNYSTLLNRSVDWEGVFSVPFYAAYPDKVDQQLLFALMQMLWDRAETNGFAHHVTDDPLPGTPSHQIMLQVAFADHQVANVSAEVEARTMGAALKVPALGTNPDTGEPWHWAVDPTFGMATTSFAPDGVWRDSGGAAVKGSVLVYWYSAGNGNLTPPNGNVPPRDGNDPHEHPRRDDAGSDQKAHFLRTGELVDVCAGAPCVTSAASRG